MVTAPAQTERGSGFPKTLPCPHCGELIILQSGLPKLPVQCTRCHKYSVFPLESRIRAASLFLAAALGTVLMSKLLSLEKASSVLGIAAYAAVLVVGVLVGARLVARSTRKTATHLVKSRGPLWFR